MKKVFLIIAVLIHFISIVSAQDANDLLEKENYKRAFLDACISEARSQKLDVNAKDFCTCSFDKLFKLLEESGAELSDVRALDQITKSKDYENAIFSCLNGDGTISEGGVEAEFVKICSKSMNKDRYMRKNTDTKEICRCTYSKIKDGPYTMNELNNLPEEQSSTYFKKISEDCIQYYFESQGFIME